VEGRDDGEAGCAWSYSLDSQEEAMITDTQAKALEQALREVDCSCGADGAPKGYIIHPDRGQPLLYLEHKACHGTGSVPWLKGVRVDCPCESWGCCSPCWHKSIGADGSAHPVDCINCQGRGWVPSLDLATWHDAVLALPGVRRISYEQDDVSIYDGWSIKPMASANAAGLHGLLLALKEMKA